MYLRFFHMMHQVFATLDCCMTTHTTKISEEFSLRIRSIVQNNISFIELFFISRLFCIGFTRKQEMSTKKTAYAQAGQVKNILSL